MKKRTTKGSDDYSKSFKPQKNSRDIYSYSSSERKHTKNRPQKEDVSLKNVLKLVGKIIIILVILFSTCTGISQ